MFYQIPSQSQPMNGYLMTVGPNSGYPATGLYGNLLGINPPLGFGSPARNDFGSICGTPPAPSLNPDIFAMSPRSGFAGNQPLPFTTAPQMFANNIHGLNFGGGPGPAWNMASGSGSFGELPVYMAASPPTPTTVQPFPPYCISEPAMAVSNFLPNQYPQFPTMGPLTPRPPNNTPTFNSGLYSTPPKQMQMLYCESPQRQPMAYYHQIHRKPLNADDQPLQQFVVNNGYDEARLCDSPGKESSDPQVNNAKNNPEGEDAGSFRYEEPELQPGDYVEYYEVGSDNENSENEAQESEPKLSRGDDDSSPQVQAFSENITASKDDDENYDGSGESESETSSSSSGDHEADEAAYFSAESPETPAKKNAENSTPPESLDWSVQVEAEAELQTGPKPNVDSPSDFLVQSFQHTTISDDKPAYEYGNGNLNNTFIQAPGLILNGYMAPFDFNSYYFNSSSSGYSTQTSSGFASQSSSRTSLGSDGSLTSFGSIGSALPLIYENYIPTLQQFSTGLAVRDTNLHEIERSFYENGEELPFVSSLWNDNPPSLFKMNEQKYDYYVPPKVDDNDYFGGQIRIWAARFHEHFSRFPHVWRIQALPELPSPVSGHHEPKWFADNMTTKLRFCCRYCKRPWTSMRGKISFLFTLDWRAGRGQAYVKIFAQVCNQSSCSTQGFQAPACYPEEVEKVVWKLSQFVGCIFYKIPYSNDLMKTRDKAIRDGHPKSQHMQELCQACQQGVCSLGKGTP